MDAIARQRAPGRQTSPMNHLSLPPIVLSLWLLSLGARVFGETEASPGGTGLTQQRFLGTPLSASIPPQNKIGSCLTPSSISPAASRAPEPASENWQLQLSPQPQGERKPKQYTVPIFSCPPVLPPPLPLRPDLVPCSGEPALTLPSYSRKPAKSPAAWRARSYKLSVSQGSLLTTNSNIFQSQQFAAPYEEVLMSLMSACAEAGFSIEALNSNAGQLLARAKDLTCPTRLVFSIAESPPGLTTVRTTPEEQPKGFKTTAMHKILLLTGDILNKRGSI